MINAVLAGRPDDLIVTTHVCRGNFRSTWVASGCYEPVAEQLFANTDYDGYFRERAGNFAPLRYLPEERKRVVLGVITSKSGTLEDRAAIVGRIEEATKCVRSEQLALSPQCGFASTQEGNLLTEEQQWAKVRSVMSIARDVWGTAG